MRKKLYILIILLFPSWLYAQQDQLYSQYLFNMLTLNPAYAGSKEELSTVLFYRNQWVGVEGAPVTLNASVHMPFKDVNGFGINLANDRIGVENRTSVNLSYAYKIRFNPSSILAFGLQGNMNFYINDFSRINTNNPVADPAFYQANTIQTTKPNFGAGIYFRNTKVALGVSVPNLISTKIAEDPSRPSAAMLKQHVLVTAAYHIKFSKDFALKPGFFGRYVDNAPPQVDLNLTAIFGDRLWVGGSWRSNSAIALMAQFALTPHLWMGYGYDYSTNALRTYQEGSHELFVGYNFNLGKTKFLSPRYF